MGEALKKQIGEAVRLLRRLRRLTHAELAQRSTLSEIDLRQIERGERDVGVDILGLLAKGLGCDLRHQVAGDGQFTVSFVIEDGLEEPPAAVLFLLAEPKDSPGKES